MPREAQPSLIERDFITSALRENIRLDGRAFDEYRNLTLEFGDEYGVVDVMLGKTRCVLMIYGSYFTTDTKIISESSCAYQQKSPHPSPTANSMASSKYPPSSPPWPLPPSRSVGTSTSPPNLPHLSLPNHVPNLTPTARPTPKSSSLAYWKSPSAAQEP